MRNKAVFFLVFFAFFTAIGLFLNPIITPFFQRLIIRILPASTMIQGQPAVIGSGDANGDGVVNWRDIQAVVEADEIQQQTPADQYEDGKINAFDFTVVTQKLATPADGKGNN
ncbi:MAG: dockerin type I domain-containing protein [Patescibacteria group bacterium]